MVSVSGSDVSTQGTYSHGAYAQSGGRIELDGGTITTTNSGSRGLSAEGAGSVIVARDVVLSTAAYNAGGAYAENGASITLHGGKITTTGNYGDGISVRGANALVSVYGTEINVGVGMGARLEGGRLVMDGGSLTAGGSAVMPGMVELGEDIFLKPVRRGNPLYAGALFDMVANPRSATVMGLLEEARQARARGHKAAAQAGSVKNLVGRAKDWFLGNF